MAEKSQMFSRIEIPPASVQWSGHFAFAIKDTKPKTAPRMGRVGGESDQNVIKINGQLSVPYIGLGRHGT